MSKLKENVISSKFRLLNSQENTEDITWSSSEASDCEVVDKNMFSNITNQLFSRKRKRKNKATRNLSNLDVTIVDAGREPSGASSIKKSPILDRQPKKQAIETSPILQTSQRFFPAFKTQILHQTPLGSIAEIPEKSPILLQKNGSSRSIVKIRENLFTEDCFASNNEGGKGRKSPIFVSKLMKNEAATCSSNTRQKEIVNEDPHVDHHRLENNLDDTLTLLKTHSDIELVKKVKAYFDDEFSTDSSSQHSITEMQTPVENESNDDIEIVSSLTQISNNKISFESIKSEPLSRVNTPVSLEADFTETTKNIKYKKDSLGYRLNKLLRKQNAATSLWQHERYLADNSEFVIPKGEFSAFRVRDVKYQYGCYFIEAMSVSDELYYIVIRNIVSGCNFSRDAVLKLYEPFSVFDYQNMKVIVNSCKFECTTI